MQRSESVSLPRHKEFVQSPLRTLPAIFFFPVFFRWPARQLLNLDLESVIQRGILSLSEKQRLIDEALEQSYEITVGGGRFGHCLAVNADHISDLRSELGDQLAKKSCGLHLRGIGAVVYRVPELENDEFFKISLRSEDWEDTTVISQVALCLCLLCWSFS